MSRQSQTKWVFSSLFSTQVPSLISQGFIAEGHSLEVACRLCCWTQRTTHCRFITLVLNPMITGCRAAQNKHAAVLSPESAYDIIPDIFWFKSPQRMFTCLSQSTHRAVCAVGATSEDHRGRKGTRVLTAVCRPLQSKEHFR